MRHYQKATFLLGAARLSQLPPDQGVEVAFVGRSNAGKSSVLNALTHNKHLARISKQPGRTQQLNIFTLDENRRILDLPGYGYAKVPLAVKEQWQETLTTYLATRTCLTGVVLVMDIRHPLKEFDQNFLIWSAENNIRVHILLNKADKLSNGQVAQAEQVVDQWLRNSPNPVSIQAFSALRNHGVSALQELLNDWYKF